MTLPCVAITPVGRPASARGLELSGGDHGSAADPDSRTSSVWPTDSVIVSPLLACVTTTFAGGEWQGWVELLAQHGWAEVLAQQGWVEVLAQHGWVELLAQQGWVELLAQQGWVDEHGGGAQLA